MSKFHKAVTDVQEYFTDLFLKVEDFILGLAFKFWVWLGAALGVRFVRPQSVVVVYQDRPETQQTLVRVTNANAELLAENRELKAKIHNMTDAFGVNAFITPPKTGPNRVNNNRKLTPSEVQEIREMKRAGTSQVDIAYAFDVNPATVSRIVRGQYHKGQKVAA